MYVEISTQIVLFTFREETPFSWFGLKWFSYQTNWMSHTSNSLLLDCLAMKFGTGSSCYVFLEEKFEENFIKKKKIEIILEKLLFLRV